MPADFSISDLRQEFGLTARAIRHYEDCGLLRPERRGTARIYSESDRKRMRLIMRGKRLGFSLDEIREMLELHYARPGEIDDPSRYLKRIEAHRTTLAALKEDVRIALDWLDTLEARCASHWRKGAERPGAISAVRHDNGGR
ncbi:MAG: MerR family DNA-binding transcriptional regulator [Alphaproteobacteria bacterium]